jgi:glycosyltransferase involved in cell wall biosynthesis
MPPTADPPRVVHLADYGGSYPGSFIPMLQAMCMAVEARGWSFESVFARGADQHPWFVQMRSRGMAVEVAPSAGIGPTALWLQRKLGRRRTAILHTHFSTFDIAGTVAARLRSHAAAVWHLHSPLLQDPKVVATNLLRFGLAGRMTDRLLCVGPEIYDKALARAAPANRTQLLGNGVDVVRFAPAPPAAQAAARERLKLTGSPPVLLLYAWDWERKGGPLFVETVAELRRRGRDALGVIVGSEGAAREAARRAGCEDAIRCLPPRDDTGELYAAADVFVAASTAEGMPFSVLEALSSGVPVVASEIASHAYVARGLPGCRLAAREPGAFADALEGVLGQEPGDQRAAAHASRQTIVRDRSLDRWAQDVMAVYDEVLP